jgi:hypothetical protein
MADALVSADPDYRNADFLAHVGEYMHDWLACLDALEGPVAQRSAAAADD